MLQTGVPALLQWCRQVTAGYPGVAVQDFGGSWRSGLAFCAIIARFRPELLDFEALDSEDCEANLQLAFSVAEAELGVPALLEAGDLAAAAEVDSRSVMTYLAQLYHKFSALPPQPALRRSLRQKTQDSVVSKDSGLEDSLSDSRHSSPVPNSSRNSSPASSSSRQSSSEDSPGKEQHSPVTTAHRSYQSLPRKEVDKPKPKPAAAKNLSFLAALQKFSNLTSASSLLLSSSTPNLHKPEPRPGPGAGHSRTIQTQTERVSRHTRAAQTEVTQAARSRHPPSARGNTGRAPGQLYARSASISSLYSAGAGAGLLPNCDRSRANPVVAGLTRYRGSQRILGPRPAHHASCDSLLAPAQPPRQYAHQPGHACCTRDTAARGGETIGVYNTRHFEHNQDYCRQRYYEPNPLYGYSSSSGHGSQGRRRRRSEAIYQNLPLAAPSPGPDHAVIYNSRDKTFSTLV